MNDDDNSRIVEQMVVLKSRLTKALSGFENEPYNEGTKRAMSAYTADRALFPVPELVFFALHHVMGFRCFGPAEKVKWTVFATVDGEPFAFSLRKFGFSILAPQDVSPKLLKRVAGQLSASLKLLEPMLKMVAKEQIARGSLTMENRMRLYEDRYRYFRDLADQSFGFTLKDAAAGPQAEEPSIERLQEAVAGINRKRVADSHGFYASSAMIDAWFSGLEHRMLLLRAFLGKPIADGGFTAFLEAKWDDRFKSLFDGRIDGPAAALLGKLRDIKAVIRNPLAHGGVENDGGAFYFHLARVGAIPANLSRYQGRLKMSFFPIPAGTHEETCAIFDQVDELLTSGSFALPNDFVRWGIDPQFDTKSLAEYGQAIAEGEEAVEALVDYLGHVWEQHVNMDY